MSSQLPSTIELEFAERFDREHAQVCHAVRPQGLVRRLAGWREQRLVRRALKVAGEPGLVFDVACGVGRFWPVLAEHGNRVILAADTSQDMLDHAKTHHPDSLLKRITLFKSSVFSIDLSENAVDSIFCMQLFHHVGDSEHRLAILREFYRVSRDTLILSVNVGRSTRQLDGPCVVISKHELQTQFALAGFSILKHYDVLPGFAQGSIYVVRKEA
ncbi:class I SAM-dependent methyltransferase [Pseudomonas sp. 7P_10.2_Bac1]|uniref:class I SAM-dependent methyltransferase n=1 Tax=Pseudomonas sp. 7P_10.2_Bac1 TaxID=2971614 RepID=UPI0021C97AD4|nr:class I SAM-dependent methyltransferase [Pseudomonas sp. 7P_10.2_Bac1]MCU1727873.1 class I SAM-dependent methyltransferase [Pseudomonas sp. 7P_10.2_Bac1]